MASWMLIEAGKSLFAAFNEVAPNRDHKTDGSIGDAAHTSTSDHTPDEQSSALRNRDADSRNEVHAIDVDADLREPGLTMAMVVGHLVARCRSGAEKRLRYIIFNRRIYSASDGWPTGGRVYSGASPHTEHAHFSFSYVSSLEASTASWHLEDIPVALTDADKKWLASEIDAAATRAADRVWAKRLDIDTSAKGVNQQPAGGILAYTSSEHHRIEGIVTAVDEKVQKLLDAQAA